MKTFLSIGSYLPLRRLALSVAGISSIGLLTACDMMNMENPFSDSHPTQVVEGPRRSPALNTLPPAQQGGMATAPVVQQMSPPPSPPLVTSAAPVPESVLAQSGQTPPAVPAASSPSSPFDGISSWFHKHTQPTTIQPSQQSPQQAYADRRAVPGNPGSTASPDASTINPWAAPAANGSLPPPPPSPAMQATPLEPSMASQSAAPMNSLPAPPALSSDTKDKAVADEDLRARCAELKPKKVKTAHHHRHKSHKLASKKKHNAVAAKKQPSSKQAKNKTQSSAPVTKVDVADDKKTYPQLSTVPPAPAELKDVKTTKDADTNALTTSKTEADKKNEELKNQLFESITPPPQGQGNVPAAPATPAAGTVPAAPAVPVVAPAGSSALPPPPPPASGVAPVQPAALPQNSNVAPAAPVSAPASTASSGGPADAMPLPPPPPPPPSPPGASLDQADHAAAA